MLPTPDEPTNSLQLADWLELEALIAKDRNSSFGDLERFLRRLGLFESRTDEDIERKIAEVADELSRRIVAAGSAYPFSMHGSVLLARSRRPKYSPYIFCLCLSYLGRGRRQLEMISARRLFEELSSAAAGNYVKGKAVRFAWPRKNISKAFKEAVNDLCSRKNIGEGLGFRQQTVSSSKDSRLDVVAWRDFPDGLPGKLLMFGACSSGGNWQSKINELNPDSFCKKWMSEQPISLVKAFFVPHRLEEPCWKHHSLDAGIIFDRCRIAFWATNGTNTIGHSEIRDWAKSILRDVATS